MILSLGCTPALQRTLRFPSFKTGEVNRVQQVLLSAGGKPVNTALALAALGIECRVTGFNGGDTGIRVERYLTEHGVNAAFTAMNSETRICTTLIDGQNGSVTELVEEAPIPTEVEIRDFIETATALLNTCKMMVICGTLPPFAPADFYRHFTQKAAALNLPVIIDSHKAALLSVLQDKPTLVKLNRRELEYTLKRAITDETQLIDAMKQITTGGAKAVLITQGKDAAYLLEGEKLSTFTPPTIEHPLNPIGSGDCTSAGIAASLLNGDSLHDSVRFGIACGSANAESLIPADISRKRVMELL